MKNERKVAYQQDRLEKATLRLRSLEQENKSLSAENKALSQIIASYKKTIEDLQIEHRRALDIYNNGMAEIRSIRDQYKAAIKSARDAEAEYESKMNVLMQRLKKEKV